MGTLQRIADLYQQELHRSHVVGRAPTCELALNHDYVSLQHACIRWTDSGWELKDLGSLNGTYLNGVRIESMLLKKGDRIAFGREEQAWEITDATGPRVMAVPHDGGSPVFEEQGMVGLPGTDNPKASIYRNSKGLWTLECADDATLLADQQTFTVDGATWTFHSPEAVISTSTLAETEARKIRNATLHFRVSVDEEHVELSVECGREHLDLGSRAHHYLLLTLARRKVQDRSHVLPPTVCGWVYQDDLTRKLLMSPGQLNVEVFRIRKQFGAFGVIDPGNIVQRRPLTKQLRIGTAHITETRV